MTTNLLWSNLESTLDNIINQFEGVAGLSIRCLNNNKTISINGDDIFPTASSIKIHILTQLFTLEDKGTIDLAKRVRFTHFDDACFRQYCDEYVYRSSRNARNK